LRKNYTFPAVTVTNTEPALETVTVNRVRSEDGCQQYIIEEGLEGGDRPTFNAEQGGKSTRRGIGNCEELTANILETST
jgi:hypothetical protein